MASTAPPAATLPPDDNRAAPGLPIYMWIGCGIATAFVVTRLTTRLVLKQAAGWDDFFIGVSYLTALILYTGTAFLLTHSYGHHVYYVSKSDLIVLLKLNTMVNIAGFASLAFARASIGLFLLRLVARIRKLTWVVYFGLALNAVQAVALIILTGLHCVPIKKMWEPTTPGFCIPPARFTAADRFLGCLNVVVDFIFALFPLVVLRHLQIRRKLRLAVYLLLSCGLLAAVCSIGRVIASDLMAQDITWDLVPLTYWALSEMSGVLILACMPAMHQLFQHMRRTDGWKRARTYLHSKVSGSKSQCHQCTGPERPTHDTDSRKDLIFPQENIRVHKDVSVELSDRPPCREASPRNFGLDGNEYHNSAQAIAGIV